MKEEINERVSTHTTEKERIRVPSLKSLIKIDKSLAELIY